MYNNCDNRKPNNMNPEKISTNMENCETMSERNKEMISIIDATNKILKNNGVEQWIIGGFATEGYKEQITREHHDIDLMAWQKDKEKIHSLLKENGYEVNDGYQDEKGEYHKFNHKIVAKLNEIKTDIIFIEQDKKTKEIFPPSCAQFRFPQQFLNGKEISLELEDNIKAEFTVPSKELLLALKIKSDRPADQEDVRWFVHQINDPRKVKEIEKKYAFDYNKFHEIITE